MLLSSGHGSENIGPESDGGHVFAEESMLQFDPPSRRISGDSLLADDEAGCSFEESQSFTKLEVAEARFSG